MDVLRAVQSGGLVLDTQCGSSFHWKCWQQLWEDKGTFETGKIKYLREIFN